MRGPVIVADTRQPVDVYGVHGARGLTQWACLARRAGLDGGWEAVEWARIPAGGVSGEHLHTRTEEVYVLLAGRGEVTLDGRPYPVAAGDAVLTGLGTRHGLRNVGDTALEWLVIEMPVGPAAEPRHAVVRDLWSAGPVDPHGVFRGPLRLLEAVRLPAGGRTVLRADGVEHTLFVTGGSGRAAVDGEAVPLVPGRALTLPLGSAVRVTAGQAGMACLHAELLAEEGEFR